MPPEIPVTVPVVALELATVAIAVLLLLHTPPADKSPKEIIVPPHTDVGPVMTAGAGITVTTALPAIDVKGVPALTV